MKNIEDYGFDRSDLVIATAVNSYLKKLMPEAREETLAGIVRQDGAKTKFNGERVVALIENAKVAAMIGSEGWKDGGDPLMIKTRHSSGSSFRCGRRRVHKKAAREVPAIHRGLDETIKHETARVEDRSTH
jgi:hypothetical protein